MRFRHVHDQGASEMMLQRTDVRVEPRRLRNSQGNLIAVFHYIHPQSRFTLIWSHGNAMDCGETFFSTLQLATQLRISIVTYDYSGYGASTGTPSESSLCSDIAEVYRYVSEVEGINPDRIVLYGQSVGSGPSVWLAMRRCVAGVVLHSALASGIRVLVPPPQNAGLIPGWCCSPACIFGPCDMFPNARRMPRIGCPALIMHGTADTVVSHSHSVELHENCAQSVSRQLHFIQGAGHDNLAEFNPAEYLRTLAGFLSSLEAGSAGELLPAKDFEKTPQDSSLQRSDS